MDTLQSIRAFHQVVEQKSFTKAADHLAMSVPMVSKHVANLERMLGAKLLHRNSRSIHLTEVGEQYYRQSLHALDVLGAAAQQAAGA
ncbi:LysR family transcriptional regulator, partial [Moraxella caviae]